VNPIDQQNPVVPMPPNIWLHGLSMAVLLILVSLAQTVLGACAIFQFLWMVFTKERNAFVAEFGRQIANWLTITARFLSGSSDEKPFPWTAWQ
jgi:hypothetical protein